MSGTMGYVTRQKAAEAARIATAAAAAENLDAVKSKLTAIVKGAAGWSGISDWAESVIDRALAGETVDLDALDAEIAVWKAQNTESSETSESEA